MFAAWRKTRADRRRWAAARTLPELGELMALWLEGELSVWPAYAVSGPDEETADLVPVLSRANRAGFVTDQSQPGCDVLGYDGSRWEQRAAVSGLVADEQMLFALARVAEVHRLTILVRTASDDPRLPAVTATKVEGEPYTAFGAPLSRRDFRHLWRGVSAAAIDEIVGAWQVTLVDPHYGPSGRLWAALDEAIALHVATPTFP